MRKFFKQLFCFHRWETLKRERYNIIGANNAPKGEVTITTLRCTKCDKITLVPSDKKMYE